MSSELNGVGMDCLAILTLLNNIRELCAKRWLGLDEQVVISAVWDEYESVHRVSYSVTRRVTFKAG